MDTMGRFQRTWTWGDSDHQEESWGSGVPATVNTQLSGVGGVPACSVFLAL